jgi:tRNA-dependent cyclodipeptide synthase
MGNEEMVTVPKSVYEAERKMRFFGTDSEDIYNKKFNVFVGISISNKKITSDMAFNYLRWAVRNTKEMVAVIIADELNIVNYEILDKYGSEKSRNRAKKVGEDFKRLFERAREKLSKNEGEKVIIYKWSDVKVSEGYEELRDFLEKQYKEDSEFKAAVLYFVKKYMRKKGRVVEDREKIDRLASYILGELPTLIEGIKIGGIHYNLVIYPTYFASGMSQFVMDMHEGELKISEKLKEKIRNRAVLVEAWLD